ncbi:hypothetical protein V495_08449 [Pseudogymnoascus sp. VKM F-4514 (FW-929)]|nr:hypothetical protein V490_07766 [Pseudogymnoascus sp. VKM F-3557]KFY33081.1 hypothetical protein V495_08449 [Pseudogymnoascus sp. VKM F-4514 (FW-929)]KFY65504.1 hypothetical protein V497_01366 [Pseudogymnoascus sp. VKM F-4516 (FW-969)]
MGIERVFSGEEKAASFANLPARRVEQGVFKNSKVLLETSPCTSPSTSNSSTTISKCASLTKPFTAAAITSGAPSVNTVPRTGARRRWSASSDGRASETERRPSRPPRTSSAASIARSITSRRNDWIGGTACDEIGDELGR